MKLMSLVALASLLGTPSMGHRAVTSPAQFAMTLAHTGNTWSATCANGCQWDAVSVTCRAECALVVDDHGMRTVAAGRFTDEKFAFRVEADGAGWRATTYTGTSWVSVGYRCRVPGCRAVLTEFGLSGP
jgi:hypothetical protein